MVGGAKRSKELEGCRYPEFANSFQEMLRAMEIDDLSNKKVGAKFGLSDTMIHNYKRGHKLPSMDQAISFADASGVSIEWLMTGRGPKSPAMVQSLQDAWDSATEEERSELFSGFMAKISR